MQGLISRNLLENQNHYWKISNIFTGNANTTQNKVIDCFSECFQDQMKNLTEKTIFSSIGFDDNTDIIQGNMWILKKEREQHLPGYWQ